MVNKAVKLLKKEPLTLKFRKLCFAESLIVIFCDASFGNLKDGSSQGVFIIFIFWKVLPNNMAKSKDQTCM